MWWIILIRGNILTNKLEKGYKPLEKAEKGFVSLHYSHDYPLLESDMVTILNELLSKVEVLFGVYHRLEVSTHCMAIIPLRGL